MNPNRTDPPVTLRLFAAADLPVLRRWFADPNIRHRISPPDDTWLKHSQSEHVTCFAIADKAGQMVGFIQVDHDPQGTAWCDMIVAPDRQGQGIGGAALRMLETIYANSGKRLCATVEPDNLASLTLLSRSGFIQDPQPDDDGLLVFRQSIPPQDG